MYRKIFIMICLVCCAVFFQSCLSFPKSSGYAIYPEQKTEYTVTIDSVDVTLDRVEDVDFEKQIREIASSMSQTVISENVEELLLKITINQRSYYENISQYNSIYMLYSLTDSSGKCVLKKGYYKKTSDSIASSAIQYNLTSKIMKEINSYITKSK